MCRRGKRKEENKVSFEETNHKENRQRSILLFEAKAIIAESNAPDIVCEDEVVDEIAVEISVADSTVISIEAKPDNEPSIVSTAPAKSTY